MEVCSLVGRRHNWLIAAALVTGMVVVVPAATPRTIITTLNHEIVAILKQPELRDRLAAEGAEPLGTTPEAFGLHLKSEIAKWAKVVAAAGLRAN